MTSTLKFSLRSFARKFKSGELTVLLLALCVAVGAMSAVGFVTDRVSQAVEHRAAESLAADLLVRSRSEIPAHYIQQAQAAGLFTARTLSFPSVLTTADAAQLAEVRGVSADYPLRGRIRIADEPFTVGTATDATPARGEVWLESRLFATLGIKPGDTVTIGHTQLRVSGVLSYLPDQGFDFVNIAPTALLNLDDVPATGLIKTSSRVRYQVLFAGERDTLTEFRSTLEPQLQTGEKLRDVHDGRSQLTRALDRADLFLSLAALVAVLLAAAAIAMATRHYCARETDNAAILKCLGSSRRRITALHCLQLLWTGLIGCSAGVALGFIAQYGLIHLLSSWLGTDLPGADIMPALNASGMGLLVLAGFGLPPILQLGDTPPLRVLRRELGPAPLPVIAVAGIAFAAIVALLLWQTSDLRLTGYVLSGAGGGVLILAAGAWLMLRALVPVQNRLGMAARFGITNLIRRGPESIAQVVAFGLGILALLLLALVRNDLLDAWKATLPDDAPNHFLINIQTEERADILGFLQQQGFTTPRLYPMVRARLQAINNRPVSELTFADGDRGRWFTEREQNLSWSGPLPEGNTIVAGHFWEENAEHSTVPPISMDDEVANDLGLKIGDTLTFNVAGESVYTTLSSLRKIKWDSFHPNFFILFPPGVLQDHPATWITSLHATAEQSPQLLQLLRAHPGVTVIDVDTILRQIRDVMQQASLAVEYVFMFTLAAGLVVLLAAVQASREARRFESAMLRTLGAPRRKVFTAVATEFALLGLLAGTLGAVTAAVSAYLLATRIFDLAWSPNPLLWLTALFGGALLVGISGLLATRRVIAQPPLTVLRRQ